MKSAFIHTIKEEKTFVFMDIIPLLLDFLHIYKYIYIYIIFFPVLLFCWFMQIIKIYN